MIGRITTTMLAMVFLSISSICAQEMTQNMSEGGRPRGVRAGVHVSTLGLGVFGAWDASDAFAVRGLVNYFGRDLDREEAGIQYEVDLELQSVGLIVDWHAFRSGLRLSGGAFVNRNEFSAMAENSGLEIGKGLYDGVLDALVDFSSVAPYLGLGWSSGRGRSGLSVGIEAGILFQGAPKLSATGMIAAAGGECEFSVSRDGKATVCPVLLSGGLKDDLEAEHRELSDDLESYQFYPVVALGVSYRF